jgi:hypothetical protein
MTARTRILTVALAASMALLSACHDTLWVYSHPAGADLRVDGRPYGTIPETGLPIDVTWTTFSDHHAELRWPGGVFLNAHLEKGVGQPNHTEYLVIDGVLAIFFIVPGLVAFCINGYGPAAQQHFYAPAPVPTNKDRSRRPAEDPKPPES